MSSKDRPTERSARPGASGRRATLSDIARAAGVSRATVDRVLNARPGVQPHTRRHVEGIAARLHGESPVVTTDAASRSLDPGDPGDPTNVLSSASAAEKIGAVAPSRRLAIVLPADDNAFYAELLAHLDAHARARGDIELSIRAVAGLRPETMAATLDSLAGAVDGVGIIGLDAPPVREALRALIATGVPLVTMVSDITHVGHASYVGIDNRAAGRLAAYLIGRFLPLHPADVALVPGALSYRGHEEREAGFRHVLRESFPHLRIVADPEVDEDAERAFAAMGDVLESHPDLAALYCIGAGQRGLVRALERAGRARDVIFVAHDLTDETRRWLLAGTMDAVIDQNARVAARETIERLVAAIDGEPVASRTVRIQPVFRENIPSDD